MNIHIKFATGKKDFLTFARAVSFHFDNDKCYWVLSVTSIRNENFHFKFDDIESFNLY